MKDWMIYEKIQEMKRNKLNKSQVSRRLGIDYKTVLEETGYLLKRAGYKIKVLNTVDFNKSMKYNPFAYIKKKAIL